MARVVNLRRLLAGVIVLAVLMAPMYYFVLRPAMQQDKTVEAPILVKTPANDSAAKVGLDVGDLAPDFEVSTTDGRRVRLSDFRGRPVVLNFFALWCGSCLAEMPQLKAAQEERGLDTFAVLAINAGETRQRALDFVDFLKAPFTYGLDTDLVISDAYRVYGLPASVFIDSKGVIQTVYAGATDRSRLDTFLDAAINAQPPGELPNALRPISTIPRDRVLSVEPRDDQLKLSSRSLRCDSGYCATFVVDRLKTVDGVTVVSADLAQDSPSLTLRFDSSLITRQQVIDTVVQALESVEDPVYQGPVTVADGG